MMAIRISNFEFHQNCRQIFIYIEGPPMDSSNNKIFKGQFPNYTQSRCISNDFIRNSSPPPSSPEIYSKLSFLSYSSFRIA